MAGTTEHFLYDYRLTEEPEVSIYQLDLSDNKMPISNELLFYALYAFFSYDLPVLKEVEFHASVTNCLNHHYMVCQLPKFLFVTTTRDFFEDQTKVTGNEKIDAIHAEIETWLTEHERNSSIFDGYLRKWEPADEETAERLDIPIGTLVGSLPEIKTKKQALQHLKFYSGQIVCEVAVRDFLHKYGQPKMETVLVEIAILEEFIQSIDIRSIPKAFENRDQDHRLEYLRLTQGYYDNHLCETTSMGKAPQVYGRYMLYLKWLKDRLNESLEPPKAKTLPRLEPARSTSNSFLEPGLMVKYEKAGMLDSFFRVPGIRIHGRYWYDIDDKETVDPEKVVRVSHVNYRQRERATSDNFEYIFERQNFITDSSGSRYQKFVVALADCVRTMITFHEELHESHQKDEAHFALTELAEDFINWLTTIKLNGETPTGSPLLQDMIPGKPIRITAMALICIYHHVVVNDENKNELVKLCNQTSGQRLYLRHNELYRKTDRVAKIESTRVLNERIKLFQELIDSSKPNSVVFNRATADLTELLSMNSIITNL